MNALTENIIGNVVASVCIFHKKYIKNKNKMKKNPKTAKSILQIYQAFGWRLLLVHVFVKYVHREKRHMQFEKWFGEYVLKFISRTRASF